MRLVQWLILTVLGTAAAAILAGAALALAIIPALLLGGLALFGWGSASSSGATAMRGSMSGPAGRRRAGLRAAAPGAGPAGTEAAGVRRPSNIPNPRRESRAGKWPSPGRLRYDGAAGRRPGT